MDKVELAVYNGFRTYMMNHRNMTFEQSTNVINEEGVFDSIVNAANEFKKTNNLSVVIKALSYNGNQTVEDMILIENYIKAGL